MGACSPRQIFEIWCSDMACDILEHYTSLYFSHSNRSLIHFTSTSMDISVHRHQWFKVSGTPRELCEGAAHISQSEFYFVDPIPNNAGQECVATSLKICSFSGLYVQTVKLTWVWICADDAHASRLQAKGRQHHLSQNIGPAVTRSAGPAL